MCNQVSLRQPNKTKQSDYDTDMTFPQQNAANRLMTKTLHESAI